MRLLRFLKNCTLVYLAIALLCIVEAYWFCDISLLGDKDAAFHNNASVGIAPDPAKTPEALVQIYQARTWSWRGLVSTHTWLAVKAAGRKNYTVYQLKGWLFYEQGTSPLSVQQDVPDRRWMGNRPALVHEVRGPRAQRIVARIPHVVAEYPFRQQYRLWPGPNSNTFIAYLGRHIPELQLDLPSTAIGKHYFEGSATGRTTSGTGFQWSFYGVAGLALSREVGFELNLLGLHFEINPRKRAVDFPGVGTLKSI